MRTSTLIERIRSECPRFASIDHALTSAADLEYPAAMVTPSKISADPDQLVGAGVHSQMVTQTFSIFIFLTRSQDGVVGYGKADDLDDLIEDLRAALTGWQAETEGWPLQFEGAMLDRYHTGVVCWREDYSLQSDLRLTR